MPSAKSFSPHEPWYKRRGWQFAFFLFLPFFQVPLMWYWELFTKRTRVWVTVAGVIWVIIIFSLPSPTETLRKDFAEHRTALLAQIKAADQAYDYHRVLALGDRYVPVHDPELDNYLYTARMAQKTVEEEASKDKLAAKEKASADKKVTEERERAAKTQADAVAQTFERSNPAKSQVYQSAWHLGSLYGIKKRSAGEHPGQQEVTFAALELGERTYPLSPQDQMDCADGFLTGFNAGYATDAERKARVEEMVAQQREKAAAEEKKKREEAAAEERARQDAAAEEKESKEVLVPVTDWSGMSKARWIRKRPKLFSGRGDNL